jgi:hypothetical protein
MSLSILQGVDCNWVILRKPSYVLYLLSAVARRPSRVDNRNDTSSETLRFSSQAMQAGAPSSIRMPRNSPLEAQELFVTVIPNAVP